MPELFLELFSEEIPARMQAKAGEDLARLVAQALEPLTPRSLRAFHGPRRIALRAEVEARIAAQRAVERGPRANAPEQALAGFLRKQNATKEQLREESGYWVLEQFKPEIPAADLIGRELPGLLRRFPWPKSMRWGGTSSFSWVRPLRRIICLLDGNIVSFDLREGDDDGHGLFSSNITEGHRFHAPGTLPVTSCRDWEEKLFKRRVIAAAEERMRLIARDLDEIAEQLDVSIVQDQGLLEELAGLVEWPVVMAGRIDPAFMGLPPEVMQVSMRTNQRYFAMRNPDGAPAPFFGFVANVDPDDGGHAIIAGNERVLRARFADARHFWDLDRKTPLASRVPTLNQVTFHAKLGSQGDRVVRLKRLAVLLATQVNADEGLAERAAELAKADLVTGMVGEFPELQGIMGRYYALYDGEDPFVADAIRDHYAPKGPGDEPPSEPVSVAVALADKLDQLAGFFAIGERPSGGGDPYALRRAGLGLLRIIRDNGLRIGLRAMLARALEGVRMQAPASSSASGNSDAALVEDLLGFIVERLRVQLRVEGTRHDVLAAVFAAGADDDVNRLLARTEAVTALLQSDDGPNLLTAYRRAANILRIEDRKDGPHTGPFARELVREAQEAALADAIGKTEQSLGALLEREQFGEAMAILAQLRPLLDSFFDRVTVNAEQPELRRNRLRLLNRVRDIMDRAADFSKIEG